eukprot:1958977-Pleurochrysis_carterae.AAC.3
MSRQPLTPPAGTYPSPFSSAPKLPCHSLFVLSAHGPRPDRPALSSQPTPSSHPSIPDSSSKASVLQPELVSEPWPQSEPALRAKPHAPRCRPRAHFRSCSHYLAFNPTDLAPSPERPSFCIALPSSQPLAPLRHHPHPQPPQRALPPIQQPQSARLRQSRLGRKLCLFACSATLSSKSTAGCAALMGVPPSTSSA